MKKLHLKIYTFKHFFLPSLGREGIIVLQNRAGLDPTDFTLCWHFIYSRPSTSQILLLGYRLSGIDLAEPLDKENILHQEINNF